jgi:shikimate dehydrogenase
MSSEGMASVTHPYLKLGLIGYPLSHSLSPLILQVAMQWLGIEGEYRLNPVPVLPEGRPALDELLKQVRGGEMHGLNVTIPHKQTVLPYMDELTDSAHTIGAVNTIYMRSGRLVGDNTDADGFWADLEPRLKSSGNFNRALVLGAGGSARAVVHALLWQGWRITLAARRIEQANNLTLEFQQRIPRRSLPGLSEFSDDPGVHTIPFNPDGLNDFLAQTVVQPSPHLLIVNTTPVGMYPDIEANPWLADIPFPNNAYVYDLIYNPAETILIRSARAQGFPASNGLGMLVEQAALAFERWTGSPAPRQAMHAAVSSQPHSTFMEDLADKR